MRVFILIFLILVLTLIPLLSCGNLHYRVIRVPQDYPTIQEAIDKALPNTIIIISEGEYNEFIKIKDKYNIIIKGEGKTIIKGFNIKNSRNITIDSLVIKNGYGILILNSSIKIRKIMIINCKDGILASDSKLSIEECNISNCREAIHIAMPYPSIIKEPIITIKECRITRCDTGIHATGYGVIKILIENCIIEDCREYGILLYEFKNTTIINNCKILNCAHGLTCENTSKVIIENCEIRNCSYEGTSIIGHLFINKCIIRKCHSGVNVGENASANITNSMILSCDHGITVKHNSRIMIEKCRISTCKLPIFS